MPNDKGAVQHLSLTVLSFDLRIKGQLLVKREADCAGL